MLVGHVRVSMAEFCIAMMAPYGNLALRVIPASLGRLGYERLPISMNELLLDAWFVQT